MNEGTFTMSGGTISGNIGVIYGDDGGDLKNKAKSGDAVYVSNSSDGYKRDSTAGDGVTLNSKRSGAEGGWE